MAFEIWRRKSRHKGNLSNITDEELIQLYKSTTEIEYVSELYIRYTHLVYGLCLKYLNNEDNSKDAVMHIYEKVLKALLKQEVHFFKSWLYIIAKNHCLAKIKENDRYTGTEIDSLQNAEFFVEYQPEITLNNESDKTEEEKLQLALQQLKDEQRICIEMFYLKDLSYKEISDSTGLSLNNVKSFIQNGKRNLKMLLSSIKSVLW